MARLFVSVANCTLHAGLKPPLGILIRRTSASLVLTRGSVSRIFYPRFPRPALRAASACFCFNSGNCAIACSSRCSFSCAARRRAALCRDDSTAEYSAFSGCPLVPQRAAAHLPATFANALRRGNCPPRAHLYPHSVLAHPAHRHHFLVHQRRHHLREQLIQRRPVVAAEIRQLAVIPTSAITIRTGCWAATQSSGHCTSIDICRRSGTRNRTAPWASARSSFSVSWLVLTYNFARL
jgi:hypothetical protein